MTATLTKPLKPCLKWVGGKTQLLPQLLENLPSSWNPKKDYYYEPFIGGGAFLFELQPLNCVIGDINPELINCYRVIRDCIGKLIETLATPLFENTPSNYYDVRSWDRKKDWGDELTREECVIRAARFIFLNKTGYRGLCRYNQKGQFNVPYGNYTEKDGSWKVIDYDFNNLVTAHTYLKNWRAFLPYSIPNSFHWKETIAPVKKGDFIYLDPPYDPLSDTSDFTDYSQHEFGRAEQVELKEAIDSLTQKGVYVMQSNSATPFILELYKDYPQVIVEAHRAINNTKGSREKVQEVIIKNY